MSAKGGGAVRASQRRALSKRIAELGDWRGRSSAECASSSRSRPDVVEWKWMGTPIWSHDGIISTGESYKNVVKLTFAKGASEGSGPSLPRVSTETSAELSTSTKGKS
jgi:hypothetical protein